MSRVLDAFSHFFSYVLTLFYLNMASFGDKFLHTFSTTPLNMTDTVSTVSTCSLRFESLLNLFAIAVGFLQSQLALSTTKFHLKWVGPGGAQIKCPRENWARLITFDNQIRGNSSFVSYKWEHCLLAMRL